MGAFKVTVQLFLVSLFFGQNALDVAKVVK
jgi:hypothetical protein